MDEGLVVRSERDMGAKMYDGTVVVCTMYISMNHIDIKHVSCTVVLWAFLGYGYYKS